MIKLVSLCVVSFKVAERIDHTKDLLYNIKGTIHERIQKLDFTKINNFCSVKGDAKRMRTQATY